MQIIEVTDFGVRSAVIQLRRPDSALRFVLYPMLHMGQARFYADVTARLRSAQVVVVEGVGRGASRRSVALVRALTLSYRVLKLRGLVEQDIDYASLGVPIVRPDVNSDEFETAWRRVPLRERLMMWVLVPMIIVGRLFGGTRFIWSKALEQNDLPTDEEQQADEESPELAAAFGGERDDRLLAAVDELHRVLHREPPAEPVEVAIVYGAGHVPALIEGLRGRYGYRARSADWLTIVNLAGDEPPIDRPRQRPRQRLGQRAGTGRGRLRGGGPRVFRIGATEPPRSVDGAR